MPAVELVERFSKSPGPGGQSVNTTDSRVELELDLAVLHGAHRRPARPGAAALAVGTDHRRGVRAPLPAPQPRRRARAARRPAARGAGTAPAAAPAHPALPRGQGAAAQGEEGARLDQGPPRPGAGPGPAGLEADAAAVAGRGTAYDVALRVGGLGELRLVVDQALLQVGVAGARGCARRGCRRSWRCRSRPWPPGCRRASARSTAASPCRRGTSAAPARRSPAAASPRRACPGRWAAPPAPAMTTDSPRVWACWPHSIISVGIRCAETTSASHATPSSVRISPAACMTGQSESEPITMPTFAVAASSGWVRLAHVPTRSRCPGRRGTRRRRAAPARGSRRGRRRRR